MTRARAIRRIPIVVGLVALALLMTPGIVGALQGDRVDGRGIDGSGNRFSFTAEATGAADRANGSFRYTFNDVDPDRRITGNVTCLLILGNAATVGGVVTNDSFAGQLEGQSFQVIVNDEAKPGDGFDDFFVFFPAQPPACPPPPQFEQNIIDGDIAVLPALP